jgi:uncharacterized protein
MSKLILGTVQMGLDYGINNSDGKISLENSYKILFKASELGIKILDTAEAYGNAHQVIGDFHKQNPHIKFDVITKIPQNSDLSTFTNKIKTYINELNVEFLEVLMFHSFDSYLENIKIVKKLLEFKNQGLIKNIGVSVYTNNQIKKLLNDDAITVVQFPFNLLDNNVLRGDLMLKLKQKGKIIHTRSAFLQGLFFKDDFESSKISKQLSSELNLIKNIAKAEEISISNLALSYCLNQENIDSVLIGVDSVDQLLENLNAINYKIKPNSLEKINAIRVDNTDLLNPSLWK